MTESPLTQDQVDELLGDIAAGATTEQIAEYERRAPARELGQQIAEARATRGLQQRELAELAGIDPAKLCAIETGTANPTWRTLTKIGAALGVRLRLDLGDAA